jgi:hypothetical protein
VLTRVNHGAPLTQGRTERAVSMRIREEIQTVRRRGDGELSPCGSAHKPRSAIIEAEEVGIHEEQAGVQGMLLL